MKNYLMDVIGQFGTSRIHSLTYNYLCRTAMIAVMILHVGCGQEAASSGAESSLGNGYSDIDPGANPVQTARYFANETALPDCDSSTEGWLVYVGSAQTFKTCASGQWSDIDLTGTQGPAGSSGQAGVGASASSDSAIDFSMGLTTVLSTIAQSQMAFVDIECIYGRGSGVKIDDTTILTAFHVIDGESNCSYRASGVPVGSGGTFRQASSGRDIGYIENINFSVDIPSIPMVRDASVDIGDRIVLVSYPVDITNDYQVTMGMVTDDDVTNSLGSLATEWAGAIVTDAAAGPGSSGGPIFNLDGEMIGIHVGGYSGAWDALDVPGLELNYQLIFENGE